MLQFRQGARIAVPLGIAVFGFGISFGVLARDAGMGVLAPLVMSATTFAGSAQFAVAAVLKGGGATSAAIVAAVLLNARYLPMGLAAAPGFRGPTSRRFALAQLTTDESWTVGHLGEGRFDMDRLVGAGVVIYVAWVGGTALGIVAGNLVDPSTFGLDAAFPALFLALLIPQLRDRRSIAAALLGAAIAITLVPLTSPGVPIVAATAAVLIGIPARGRRR